MLCVHENLYERMSSNEQVVSKPSSRPFPPSKQICRAA